MVSRDVIFDEVTAWKWEDNSFLKQKFFEPLDAGNGQQTLTPNLSPNQTLQAVQKAHHRRISIQQERYVPCGTYMTRVILPSSLMNHRTLKKLQMKKYGERQWTTKLQLSRKITRGIL